MHRQGIVESKTETHTHLKRNELLLLLIITIFFFFLLRYRRLLLFLVLRKADMWIKTKRACAGEKQGEDNIAEQGQGAREKG